MDDAASIWRLIQRCPPLDVNSSYAYLLLSHHFGNTCVVAKVEDEIVGFVSAYAPPGQPDTLFVWQVAVDPRARGRQLGAQMVLDLLSRGGPGRWRSLETTVSPSNVASRRMFKRVAREMGAELNEQTLFTQNHLGEAGHEEERLLLIGPFGHGEKRDNGKGVGG